MESLQVKSLIVITLTDFYEITYSLKHFMSMHIDNINTHLCIFVGNFQNPCLSGVLGYYTSGSLTSKIFIEHLLPAR